MSLNLNTAILDDENTGTAVLSVDQTDGSIKHIISNLTYPIGQYVEGGDNKGITINIEIVMTYTDTNRSQRWELLNYYYPNSAAFGSYTLEGTTNPLYYANGAWTTYAYVYYFTEYGNLHVRKSNIVNLTITGDTDCWHEEPLDNTVVSTSGYSANLSARQEVDEYTWDDETNSSVLYEAHGPEDVTITIQNPTYPFDGVITEDAGGATYGIKFYKKRPNDTDFTTEGFLRYNQIHTISGSPVINLEDLDVGTWQFYAELYYTTQSGYGVDENSFVYTTNTVSYTVTEDLSIHYEEAIRDDENTGSATLSTWTSSRTGTQYLEIENLTYPLRRAQTLSDKNGTTGAIKYYGKRASDDSYIELWTFTPEEGYEGGTSENYDIENLFYEMDDYYGEWEIYADIYYYTTEGNLHVRKTNEVTVNVLKPVDSDPDPDPDDEILDTTANITLKEVYTEDGSTMTHMIFVNDLTYAFGDSSTTTTGITTKWYLYGKLEGEDEYKRAVNLDGKWIVGMSNAGMAIDGDYGFIQYQENKYGTWEFYAVIEYYTNEGNLRTRTLNTVTCTIENPWPEAVVHATIRRGKVQRMGRLVNY